MGKFAL